VTPRPAPARLADRVPRRGGQHRPGLLTDDENARLAEAAWAVYDLGANTVVVEELLASGSSSRLWRLAGYGPGGLSGYVVKWFRPRARQAGRAVATEYAALTRLAGVLSGLTTEAYAVGCPAPVQVWDWGYAMTAVPGVRLDRAVARGLVADVPSLAADLVTALRAYHADGGGPYGDFEPGNVLFDRPRSVYLLDPAPPVEPVPAAPLAADLASWVQGAGVRAVRQAVRHPHAVAGGRALGAAVLRAAGGPELRAEVEHCLAQRWDRLRRQGPHRRALAVAYQRLLDRSPAGGRP
jgi:hypothetical protein